MEVDDEEAPRLKWDEANLYLTEQDRGHAMKIDEPKTPYVRQYDPTEDEAEIAAIDASEVLVDELDMEKGSHAQVSNQESRKKKREDAIPDLDLGEPEEPVHESRGSEGEKRVVVESVGGEGEGSVGDGVSGRDDDEEGEQHMTLEERKKHREFEARRRKHYNMHNVRDVLG